MGVKVVARERGLVYWMSQGSDFYSECKALNRLPSPKVWVGRLNFRKGRFARGVCFLTDHGSVGWLPANVGCFTGFRRDQIFIRKGVCFLTDHGSVFTGFRRYQIFIRNAKS